MFFNKTAGQHGLNGEYESRSKFAIKASKDETLRCVAVL